MVQTIKNLENSIHKTNRWINEVKTMLEWEDDQEAYTALEGTLHLIRDMLTIEEATDLGSQLPLILKGSYYSNWNPSRTPIHLDKSSFVSKVHAVLGNNPDVEPTITVKKIFNFIDTKITDGQVKHIKDNLPEDIKQLWDT